MDKKQELIDGWYTLSNIAKQHRTAGNLFNSLAEGYYGVEWFKIPSLMDNDRIIDTMDYGNDSLTFKEFDKLVIDAIEQEESTGT